ncbi:transketolase [Microgenomates group bacterium]|nr:transketolase [Microgenomates group bacterium]
MTKVINRLKKEIIRAAYQAQEGHVASAFSILDMLWVLYDRVLKKDYFILSKGHGCLGLYAVLAEKGFFPKSWLKDFGKYNSKLGGHPDWKQVPGVEASTGSLGHGLPMAVGMALGLKIKKKLKKVYCLIGDGEANEGSIWEAVMLGAQHRLDNLICLVDYNHSTDRALELGDLREKFSSFGWQVTKINGHNHQEIYQALKKQADKPLAIIAKTIKGYGVKEMENNPAWHHRSPTKEEMERILTELS